MPFRVAVPSFLLVLGALTPTAAAQPSVMRSWVTPAGAEDCGTAASLDGEVARLLGGDPAGRRFAFRAEGRVVAGAEGALALTLSLADADGATIGSRTLRARSCSALAEAAALLVALAIDPGAVAEATAAEGQSAALPEAVVLEGGASLDPPARSESASESASESESEAASESGAARSWPTGFGLEAGVVLELGTMPAPAAGVALGVRLARRRLRAAIQVVALLPRGASVERVGGDPATADFFGIGARLELGGGWTRGVLSVEAGALLDLLVLSGASEGVSDPARGTAVVALLGGVARALFRVGGLQLGVEADLRVPLARPRFVVTGLGEAHRPAPVAGRVALVLRYPAR